MSDKKRSPIEDVRHLGFVTQFGFTMAAGIVIGVFGGRWLDNKFGVAPLFLIIGLFLGLASGVINIWRLVSPQKKKDDKSDATGK